MEGIKLKGKFKIDFYQWLSINFEMIDIGQNEYNIGYLFLDLPQSAQFGLIQEYCDIIGYDINATPDRSIISVKNEILSYKIWITRQEAQIEAVAQVQSIINK